MVFIHWNMTYLSNYAKISHFQLLSIHFIQSKTQNHILLAPNLFHPSEKAEFCKGTFFYHQDYILKFQRWLYFLKLNGRTEHVSQTCASDWFLHFGPCVYLRGSLVISLVCPSVGLSIGPCFVFKYLSDRLLLVVCFFHFGDIFNVFSLSLHPVIKNF